MSKIIEQIFADKKNSKISPKSKKVAEKNTEQRSSIKIDKTCQSWGILIVLDNNQLLPKTLDFPTATRTYTLKCQQAKRGGGSKGDSHIYLKSTFDDINAYKCLKGLWRDGGEKGA